MKSIKYVLPGNPIAWTRAVPNYGKHRMYDSQKNVRLIIGIEIQKQHGTAPNFEGAIALEAYYYFTPPQRCNPDKLPEWHLTKPDTSNLTKLYEDILSCDLGIIKNDSMICKEYCEKRYSLEPKTIIILTEL